MQPLCNSRAYWWMIAFSSNVLSVLEIWHQWSNYTCFTWCCSYPGFRLSCQPLFSQPQDWSSPIWFILGEFPGPSWDPANWNWQRGSLKSEGDLPTPDSALHCSADEWGRGNKGRATRVTPTPWHNLEVAGCARSYTVVLPESQCCKWARCCKWAWCCKLASFIKNVYRCACRHKVL